MKKLCAALLFLLGLASAAQAENSVGPTNRIFCNKSIAVTAGSSSITQVVAAIAGQTINFCGWSVTNTGSTGTFSVQTGTGTNCGTNTATFVPVLSITSTAPSTDHVSDAWFSSPISSELCWTPSAATISAIFYFSQF